MSFWASRKGSYYRRFNEENLFDKEIDLLIDSYEEKLQEEQNNVRHLQDKLKVLNKEKQLRESINKKINFKQRDKREIGIKLNTNFKDDEKHYLKIKEKEQEYKSLAHIYDIFP